MKAKDRMSKENQLNNFQVGVTEPRRVAVTTLASRVSEEMGTPLGRTVGYSIRLDECFDRDLTKIKFMTEGILVSFKTLKII